MLVAMSTHKKEQQVNRLFDMAKERDNILNAKHILCIRFVVEPKKNIECYSNQVIFLDVSIMESK